ncbi:MAG TPA: hypothetical protein VLE49_14065 [Anaerolineales bacterium]|nr:hypothetical protein [Anaerolineales bacterium]
MLLIDVYKIPVQWSLLATASILSVTMLLSVIVPAKAEAKLRDAYPFSSKPERTEREHR